MLTRTCRRSPRRAGAFSRNRLNAMMCASSRMVVKRKDAERPAVVACTLLPYDAQFELGTSLAEAAGAVALNPSALRQVSACWGGGSCTRS